MRHPTRSGSATPELLLLLVLDHDFEPLLEVLLHADAAALQKVLDSLDFSFEVF